VDSADRRARNEALFRDLNERVTEIQQGLEGPGNALEFEILCECSNVGCAEVLVLSPEEYEEVRSDPTHFIVVPDHVDREIETAVRRTERFSVVEKDPGEGHIARETDPRSR
jgi:hypothetical protein